MSLKKVKVEGGRYTHYTSAEEVLVHQSQQTKPAVHNRQSAFERENERKGERER